MQVRVWVNKRKVHLTRGRGVFFFSFEAKPESE